MKKILYVVVTLVILVIAFFAFNSYIYHQKQGTTQKALTPKDAVYVVQGRLVHLNQETNLTNSVTTTYFGNEVSKDLDLDGREDVAFLITETSADHKTSFYVVGALNKEEGYVGTQALFIGEDISPQVTEKGAGKIVVVNYVDKNSVGKSLWLALDSETMQWGEVVQNFEGEADPSTMTLTMKTWNWINTILSDGALIVPRKSAEFGITFASDGTFTATTDCNSMGGSYAVRGAVISFNNMYSTKKYCEGSQENDFAKTLSRIEGYQFTSKGELVFTLRDKGTATFR